MPRSLNPLTEKLGPYRIRGSDKETIQRRAARARMTEAEYVRQRALGKACRPVEDDDGDNESEGDDE